MTGPRIHIPKTQRKSPRDPRVASPEAESAKLAAAREVERKQRDQEVADRAAAARKPKEQA